MGGGERGAVVERAGIQAAAGGADAAEQGVRENVLAAMESAPRPPTMVAANVFPLPMLLKMLPSKFRLSRLRLSKASLKMAGLSWMRPALRRQSLMMRFLKSPPAPSRRWNARSLAVLMVWGLPLPIKVRLENLGREYLVVSVVGPKGNRKPSPSMHWFPETSVLAALKMQRPYCSLPRKPKSKSKPSSLP